MQNGSTRRAGTNPGRDWRPGGWRWRCAMVAAVLIGSAATRAVALPMPELLKDINPGASSSSPSYLVDVGGTPFFSANDGTNGSELWRSGGSAPGTVLVKDIHPSVSGSSAPSPLVD